MLSLQDLETPAVIVDLDVLEANLARMAGRARVAGVRLRPHAKTHKIPALGRLQLAAGAAGISLAKVGEAEVFVGEGFEDVFLAYPIVGAAKARRLLALSDRTRLAIGADSVEGAASIGEVFHAAGLRIDVLLKVDCGYHRVGVAPERVVEVGQRVAELPGIALRGSLRRMPLNMPGMNRPPGAVLRMRTSTIVPRPPGASTKPCPPFRAARPRTSRSSRT